MIEYLRAAEVADRLGVHRASIYARTKAGTIPQPDAVIRGKAAGRRGDGTVYLWLPETIDRWKAANERPNWRAVDKATHQP